MINPLELSILASYIIIFIIITPKWLLSYFHTGLEDQSKKQMKRQCKNTFLWEQKFSKKQTKPY